VAETGGERRLWRKRAGRLAAPRSIALFVGGPLLVLAALAAATTVTDPSAMALPDRFTPPLSYGVGGSFYLLGTDQVGRSYLHRLIDAMLFSVSFALIGSALSCFFGLCISVFFTSRNRIVRYVFDQIIFLQISIPYILIIIIISSFLGRTPTVLLIAFALYGWELTARTFSEQINQIRNGPMISAAQLAGANSVEIITNYYFPLVLPQIAIVFALNFSKIIIAESTLSFVGLGIQPPQASLGTLLSAARDTIDQAWWGVVLPALAIVLCGLWAAITIHQLASRKRP